MKQHPPGHSFPFHPTMSSINFPKHERRSSSFSTSSQAVGFYNANLSPRKPAEDEGILQHAFKMPSKSSEAASAAKDKPPMSAGVKRPMQLSMNQFVSTQRAAVGKFSGIIKAVQDAEDDDIKATSNIETRPI